MLDLSRVRLSISDSRSCTSPLPGTKIKRGEPEKRGKRFLGGRKGEKENVRMFRTKRREGSEEEGEEGESVRTT